MNTDTSTTANPIAPKAFNLGGITPGKGANWRGLMFSVLFKDGNMKAYPYAYIHNITYNKSGKIEIELGAEKLVITGRDLYEGYEALVDHLVREIVEANITYQKAPDKVAVIHQIEIVKR